MKRPPGFADIVPYCIVTDAPRFIDFLVRGLGGVEVLRHLRPDGQVANAQVRLGATCLMVTESSPAFPAMAAAYYHYVADADAAVQQACRHGAELLMAVADMPYGDRQGGVRDGHGNLWWISQRLVDGPYGP